MRIMEETFAHWVEHELFNRETAFCVRSLWQNWLTSPYVARHPVDALQRTASVYLIAGLSGSRAGPDQTLRFEDDLADAAAERGEGRVPDSVCGGLVESAWLTTVDQANPDRAEPFGIGVPRFPKMWRDELGDPERYERLVWESLRQIILPFMQRVMVSHRDLAHNLRDLLALAAWPECSPDEYGRQQSALREGAILAEPLHKPARQVLDLNRFVTQAGRTIPLATARTDNALLFSLAHQWMIHSTYPSFISLGGDDWGDQ